MVTLPSSTPKTPSRQLHPRRSPLHFCSTTPPPQSKWSVSVTSPRSHPPMAALALVALQLVRQPPCPPLSSGPVATIRRCGRVFGIAGVRDLGPGGMFPLPFFLASRPVAAHQMGVGASPAADAESLGAGDPVTLVEYVGKGAGDDLALLFTHLQYACKRIAMLVASPFSTELGRRGDVPAGSVSSASGRDAPKPLDVVANEIILSSLQKSRKAAVMASEEDDAPVWINDDGPFVVVTDPLDGSRNIDASIPTGTIFGIYNRLVELDHLPMEEKASLNSLQSGTHLVAAGYVLYSSATIFCVSFGSGTHAFTLDHSTGEFVLTHPFIEVPRRGQIYSVNDARYFDWPEGLRRYIDTVRQGKGQFPKKYSARYICSLVADFHRTLMYGGIVMNPRDHLRLVYEANPLSYLVENAGGKGSDGRLRILSIQPVELHQRLPLFLGSAEDMEELESYNDIQQKINPGYEV